MLSLMQILNIALVWLFVWNVLSQSKEFALMKIRRIRSPKAETPQTLHKMFSSDNTMSRRVHVQAADASPSVECQSRPSHFPKLRPVMTNETDMMNDRQSSDSDSSSSPTSTPSTHSSLGLQFQLEFPNHEPKKATNKWVKLFLSIYLWSRLFIFLLSVILLVLSVSYFMGQLLHTKLDLITLCPEPKTREQIWRHSYESSLKSQYHTNGAFTLNEESQYGFTDEPCWSTRQIDINTDELWHTNKYIYAWQSMGWKAILFALVAVYALVIIMYNLFTMVSDIISIANNTIHTKSGLFTIDSNKTETIDSNKTLSKLISKCRHCASFYVKYLGSDTTGWIVISFISEISEFLLQSQALLLYNGYHLFDPHSTKDVYLPNKPQYIHLFAAIIAFNCLGSGILWLCYAMFHTKCHGLIFKLSIYFVDQFSDLLYTLFPFIIIFTDDYNANATNVLVLLGQLNVTSTLSFLASFLPLLLSCNKCLVVLLNAIHEMRNMFYDEWKENTTVTYHDEGIDMGSTKDSWIVRKSSRGMRRKVVLIVVSIIYILFGLFVFMFVRYYLNDAVSYCMSVTEDLYFQNNTFSNHSLSVHEIQILAHNPELFYWDKCVYKTYPFVSNDLYKCQCRVLVMDWTDVGSTADQRKLYFNLTQNTIFTGMLEHWTALEKFSTTGSEQAYFVDHTLSASMFKAVHMKAFEWKHAQITLVEDGISSWNKLEYLRFEETNQMELPSDFHKLKELKYLSLQVFDEQICALRQLQVLQIQWASMRSIPFCISDLQSLNELLIDVNFELTDVPISIFSLPNLIDLSLFLSGFTYHHLLAYNLPQNISINDTINANQWFNDHFVWNDPHQTSYWLAQTPICEENIWELPWKLQLFINETNACYYPCQNDQSNSLDLSTPLCMPMLFGDGKCDKTCNFGTCFYDGGDCLQLCFANPELTNCTWDKYTNDRCDAGCDNMYCRGTIWGSNLERFLYSADGHQCEGERVVSRNVSQCKSSQSIYIDSSNDKIYGQCEPIWISDGFCDDSCRTDECNQDAEDCHLGCVDDYCHQIYQGWSLLMSMIDTENDHKFNYTSMCANLWDLAVHYLEIEDDVDCRMAAENADYNEDGYLNFREFVTVGIQVIASQWYEKSTQVNCSACVGMDVYNV
eukprot:225519_1